MFVLLDSNVWLAALARDGVCRRVMESSAAFCTPVVTPFVCAEVREKLVTRFHRTQEQADELVSTPNDFGVVAPKRCRRNIIALA